MPVASARLARDAQTSPGVLPQESAPARSYSYFITYCSSQYVYGEVVRPGEPCRVCCFKFGPDPISPTPLLIYNRLKALRFGFLASLHHHRSSIIRDALRRFESPRPGSPTQRRSRRAGHSTWSAHHLQRRRSHRKRPAGVPLLLERNFVRVVWTLCS